MSSVRIAVSVDVQESIRRGKPSAAKAVLTVSADDLAALSQEQRDTIALWTRPADSHYSRDYPPHDVYAVEPPTCNSWYPVHEVSLAGLLLSIATAQTVAQEKAAQKDADEETQRVKVRAATQAVLDARKVSEGSSSATRAELSERYTTYRPDWPYYADEEIRKTPLAQSWTAQLNALTAAARTEAEARLTARLKERAEQKAAVKARKESGTAVLREWSLAHGSELLRARITDGFEWLALAQQEYVDSAVKGIDLPKAPSEAGDADKVESKDREHPSLAEILLLRDLRAKWESAPEDAPEIDAELQWVTYTYEADPEEYDDERKESQPELWVTVTTPDGTGVTRYYDLSTIVTDAVTQE